MEQSEETFNVQPWLLGLCFAAVLSMQGWILTSIVELKGTVSKLSGQFEMHIAESDRVAKK